MPQNDLPTGKYAMTPAERKKLFGVQRGGPKIKGYGGTPGKGPAGETCGSCKHHATRRFAKTYHKCELMRAVWTGGEGTDIRLGSPACENWHAAE